MLIWTRWEIYVFTFIALLVTVLFEVVGLKWLQLPWTPIALIGTAVAFLIGFQSNAAYGRIWEARQIWGGMVNDSRSWGMMVKDMVTTEYANEKTSEEELADHKRILIYRQIAWLTALRYAMRQKRPWEVFSKGRTNKEWADRMPIPELEGVLDEDLKKLLSDNEVEYVLRKTNKATAIMTLQSKHLRALKERGIIWEFSFLEMEGIIRELTTHQGKSERIKNFPYPRQFATLGYDFVKVFVVLLPLAVVPEFSKIGSLLLESFPLVGSYFVWASVPFIVILSWTFHTMQRIGAVGENPFEGSANDVPISTIARGIEIDLREMLEEENIPEPLPERFNIQM